MLEQLTADKNAAEKVPPAEWQNGRMAEVKLRH